MPFLVCIVGTGAICCFYLCKGSWKDSKNAWNELHNNFWERDKLKKIDKSWAVKYNV